MKKLMIVIEESENGEFNCYLSGDKERIGKIPDEHLGPAEFYGSKLFSICIGVLKQSGAVKSIKPQQE